MVTHIHPDHYGLAGRIREASGAWISLHPADAELIHDRYDEPDDLLDRVAAALRRMGAPPEELEPLQQRRHAGAPAGRRRRPGPAARGRGTAGGAGVGPAGHLDARATRRATSASTSRRQELMLSGDHVLPAHHPEHPVPPPGGGEPAGRLPRLARQARALRVQRGAARSRVPLRRPARPAGGAAPAPPRPLRRGRSPSCGTGRTPPGRSPSHMKWSRPWDDIAGFMRRAAVGETVSHLRVLEIDGVVQVEDGEPALWSLAEHADRDPPGRCRAVSARSSPPAPARRRSGPAVTPRPAAACPGSG